MINDIDTSIFQIAEFLNNIGNLNLKMNDDFLKSIKISTNFKKLQLLEKHQKFDEATPKAHFLRSSDHYWTNDHCRRCWGSERENRD